MKCHDTREAGVADIDKHLPGTTHAVREWFRDYKVPEGKKQNSFALNERFQEPDYALHVIQETHTAWSSLLAGKSPAGKLWLPTNSIDSAKK